MRAQSAAIAFVMKVADRELGKPCAFVMANHMNKEKQRSQPTAVFTRDCIHYLWGVNHQVKPKTNAAFASQ